MLVRGNFIDNSIVTLDRRVQAKKSVNSIACPRNE